MTRPRRALGAVPPIADGPAASPPRFLAVAVADPADLDAAAPMAVPGLEAAAERSAGGVRASGVGIEPPEPGSGRAVLLGGVARRRDDDQTPEQLHWLLADRAGDGVGELLPTFAAASWTGAGTLRAAADPLGFRALYHVEGPGWGALATSTDALAGAAGGGLDDEGLAVQSQLGWQLGQRTLFADVTKLTPGSVATLTHGRLVLESHRASPVRLSLDAAVVEAARLLRRYLDAYLEDHPDAILQLTGGLDSRILLAAIPPARRRGLRVVTLGVPGVPDLDIAADLCRRYGMRHEILALDGLEQLDPDEAYERCVEAALALDVNADPLAYAALQLAESRAEEGPRLSGLGGEVARGFYYHGRFDGRVSERRAHRLAAWRMFVNESIESTALDAEFADWARQVAHREVYRALSGPGGGWFAATDALYLGHRMQRWGGITESAVCWRREVVNPMLDDRFIAIACGLAPADKHNARFLSRLLIELDSQLAAIPLDGRPAPVHYARATVTGSSRRLASTAAKTVNKAVQRARRVNRPPVGGAVLAQKVVARWRAEPALLAPVAELGIVRREWLADLLAGRVEPTSSTVAFLLNAAVAQSVLARNRARTSAPPYGGPRTALKGGRE